MSRKMLKLVVIITLAGPLGGCDPGSNQAGSANGSPRATKMFNDVEVRMRGCELLPLQLVAKALEVKEDLLKQSKVMLGCEYDSRDPKQAIEARISVIMAFESKEAAAKVFDHATKSMTAAEAQQKLDESMARSKKWPTDGGVSRFEKPPGGWTGPAPAEAVRFGPIEGVGDAARINLDTGTLTVRVHNLTFNITGYKGQPAPNNPKPMDLLEHVKASQAEEKKWKQDTFEVRKRCGVKLAKAIVDNL